MSSLKHCTVMASLSLMAALIAVHLPPSSAGSSLQHFTVEVYNEMKSGEKLFVRCKSKNDDLGEHNLNYGEKFSWSFRENFWRTTLFWCYMRNNDKHVSLEVFWGDDDWLDDRCNDEDCIWSARDDGIYLKNIPLNVYEFRTKWEDGF